jgi:hypothetical protein
LASGRRLLLRNAVLVEAPPEAPDADALAKQEFKREKAVFFESCRAERNRFIETKTDQTKSYDQTILTFSAGAIALSITFVEKIAPSPSVPWLLYGAWSCFGLAVLSVVASFLFIQEAFQNEIDSVDAKWDALLAAEAAAATGATPPDAVPQAAQPNRYTTQTRNLNFASGGLFVSGIVFFVLFGAFNWPAKEETSKITGTPIKIEITGEVMPGKMNVVTTSGGSVQIQKGATATSAMLTTAPQPPAPTAAPASTPTASSTSSTSK